MPARTNILTSYALTVDFFQCNIQLNPERSITGPLPVDLVALAYSEALDTYNAAGFTVKKTRSSDDAYHLRLNIFAPGGQQLGYLLTDRTKKYGVKQRLRAFHAENSVFYTCEFGVLFSAFLQAFGLELANIARLDIALDTQQRNLARLIESYTSKTNEYQLVTRKNDPGPVLFGATTYYGHRSKKVQLSIYDKSREMREKQPKSYITDWYAANGFGTAAYDPAKPVYRAELSLRTDAFKKYDRYVVTEDGTKLSPYRAESLGASKTRKQTDTKTTGVTLERLNSPGYLATLFEKFLPVDIRKKDVTRATNATPVPLIDFSIYGRESLNITVVTRPTGNPLAMEKKTLKQLVVEYRDTGKSLYLVTARDLAQRHQLTETLAQLLTKFGPLLPSQLLAA